MPLILALGGGAAAGVLCAQDADPPPAKAKENEQGARAVEKTTPLEETKNPKRKAKLRVAPKEHLSEDESGFLGVATRPIDPTLSAQLGLMKGAGLVVEYVEEDSPAARAGIKSNDILHKVGDQILVNGEQLRTLIGARRGGDKVALTIIRGGKKQELQATLISREEAGAAHPAPGPGGINLDPLFQNLIPRGGRLQLQFPPAGGAPAGGANAQGKAVMSDGSGRYEVTNDNGKKHLKATDPDGKVIFDGPINTEEERKKVPPEVMNKVEAMKVEVQPLQFQLNFDDMLKGFLGGPGVRNNRAQMQFDRMMKLIEEMGGDVPDGFDHGNLRKMLKDAFGVEIPDQKPGAEPGREPLDPKTIH